jgi:hypothetical protein
MSASPEVPKFTFCCPKCGYSTHYRIERTGPGYSAARSEWADKVMACLCGKRLYGDSIPEEYDRQEAAFLEEQAEQAAEAARQKRREARKRREAKKKGPKVAFVSPATLDPSQDMCAKDTLERVSVTTICAFDGCENPKRVNSVYCSRNCSNKNARARHAARKKGTVQ